MVVVANNECLLAYHRVGEMADAPGPKQAMYWESFHVPPLGAASCLNGAFDHDPSNA